jgi:hypothetical protein
MSVEMCTYEMSSTKTPQFQSSLIRIDYEKIYFCIERH